MKLQRKKSFLSQTGSGRISSLNKPRVLTGLLTAVMSLGFAAAASADVRLPALFSDNMVLQRNKPITIWGWADEGEGIRVDFRDQRIHTRAKNGQWKVELKALRAGGSDILRVAGKNEILVRNVTVGEVWVCSGQSNMEWPMTASYQPQQDIANSANGNIRLFTVPKLKAESPVDDVKSSWKECTPDNVKNFSAVAYYFGRELQKTLGVPVGLIHTSWGGSPAEVWMSRDVLENDIDFKRDILDSSETAMKWYQAELDKFKKEEAELAAQGKKIERRPPGMPWRPTELYNGMIAPLTNYVIRGAIWYQGESNAGRARQYESLFPAMITNWRRDFNQGDFPFLAVQLAPWDKNKKRTLDQIVEKPGESDWAELREAQVLTTRALSHVGLAVITDAGDKDDIHPAKKEIVGKRLALAARGIAYNHNIVYSGPTYQKMKVNGSKVVLHFDNVGSGLTTPDDELRGFAIAGADGKFVWADAKFDGKDRIIVSSPDVPHPVAVRYGWADYPIVNLWNRNGLPASPFRTDNYPRR